MRTEKGLTPTGVARIKDRKTEKIAPALRARFRRVAAPLAALMILAGAWLLGKRLVRPEIAYDNYISVEFTAHGSRNIQKSQIEYLLLRSLTASTRWHIYAHDDVLTYKKQTQSKEVLFRPAMLTISGDVYRKVTGFA